MIIVNFGGGYHSFTENRKGASVGKGLSSVRLPKGGQRRREGVTLCG